MDSVLLVRDEVTDIVLMYTRCLLKEQRTEIIGSCGDCSLNTFWILSCVVLFHSHHKEKYTRLCDPTFSLKKKKKKHVGEGWGVSSPPCRALVTGSAQVGLGWLQDSEPWAPRAPQCHTTHWTLISLLLFCPSWILLLSPEWLCSRAQVVSSVDCLRGEDYHELCMQEGKECCCGFFLRVF